jgi:ABC-type uncharacterized transport system fused permease/ATPase subunit
MIKLKWPPLLTALLLLIIIAEIASTSYIPEFRKIFYGALEVKSKADIAYAVFVFIVVSSILTASQSLKRFVAATISLNLRGQLTKRLTKFWQPHKTLENTSQRINEDTKLATELALKVLIEMVISGAIVIVLVIESRGDKILLAAALAYTVVVSIFAKFFKPKLINTEIALQRAEATHRHNLSEAIVKDNRGKLAATLQDFREVANKYTSNLRVLLGYSTFSAAQNNFSILAPWLILIPMYLLGSISLGELMSKVSKFELIVINSTILITLYPEMTKAQASWIRIKEFLK